MLSASMRRWLAILFSLVSAVAVPLQLSAAESSPAGQHTQYPPVTGYADVFASLDQAMARAAADQKLLMVVLGANWCHDSRAFIDRMAQPEFSALLKQRYLVERVNIGYFDYVRGVIQRFGVPVIYGTPTVLVVEPLNGQVLNLDTLPYWRNAERIDLAATVDYFSAFEPGQSRPEKADLPPALAQAMARIDDFEAAQAERIYAAYAELGPLLRAYEAEGEADGFMDKWQSLADMRGRITEDLAALRALAREKFARGEAIELSFPDYPLFID